MSPGSGKHRICNGDRGARAIATVWSRRRLAWILLLGQLPGCAAVLLGFSDVLYGVERSAQLDASPDVDCVRRVLGATPGIEQIRYYTTPAARSLSWRGVETTGEVHTLLYQSEGIHAAIQFSEDGQKRVILAHTSLYMHEPPPQEEVDAIRPVMRGVEVALEGECGLEGLAASIEEICYGVACPDSSP